jgi:hypothetical protein
VASTGDKNIKAALQVSKWIFAIFCKNTDVEILIYDVETGSKVKEYLKPDGKVFDTPMKSQIDVSSLQLKETSLPSCQLDCCLRVFVSNQRSQLEFPSLDATGFGPAQYWQSAAAPSTT